MPAETITEVEQVSAWLDTASRTATEAADHFNRVVELCESSADASDETWTLLEARALLGQACLARRWAVWAVEECDKALKALGDQVCYAEEAEGLTDA
jgi:hypothetical protein